EYARAGLKIVPIERGVSGAKQRIVFYSALLLMVSLQVARLGVGGPIYLAAALALGLVFVAIALYGLRKDAGERWARGLFFYTLIYLPALFGALALGRA